MTLGEGGGGSRGLGVEPRRRRQVPRLLGEMGRGRLVAGDRRVHGRQGGRTRGRTVGLTDRDRPVELHYRAPGQPEQLVVPADDLHPVGLLGPERIGVQSRDGGLRLELAEPVPRECGLQHGDAFGDEPGVPERAVLLGERDQFAVGPGPGRTTRVVQEHQRQQPGGLLVGGD